MHCDVYITLVLIYWDLSTLCVSLAHVVNASRGEVNP